MFPQIKAVFKNNTNTEIPNLIIKSDNVNLINKETINVGKCISQAENTIITEPIGKANVLAKYLADINNKERITSSPRLEQIINKTIDNFKTKNKIVENQINTQINFTTQNTAINPIFEKNLNYFYDYLTFTKIIRNLNNKKSMGVDNIPTIALKNLPHNFVTFLLIIFNNLLNNGYFPDKWKLAKVIPILKKNKDPRKVSSYRPISLLPNMGKLFEILVTKSLSKFIEDNKLLPHEQFGFRLKTSTIHATTKFTSDIAKELSEKRVVAACLIDLERAFDTAWIEGLIYRLIKKGVPDHIIKMIWSMLKDKRMFVSINNTTNSKVYNLRGGLQQGAVSSPLLFNILLSDVLKMYGINGSPLLKGIGFADDLVIYRSSKRVVKAKNGLQDAFHGVCDFFGTWKLSCNYNKCESILFRPLIDEMTKKIGKGGIPLI